MTDVTDEDVKGALEQLTQQKKALKPIDEPVQDGDFVKVDMEFVTEAGASIAERNGDIAQPIDVASAPNGRTFGAFEEFLLSPSE